MAGYLFSHLVLLWFLTFGPYTTNLAFPSKEQSWNNHSLSFVPLDLDVRLLSLDLSNNFIRQLHTLVLPLLKQLDLSNNQLDFISEGAFENLTQLELLNLSRNELNNNLGNNSKALQSLSNLKNLDISGNGLSNEAVELYLKNKSSLLQLKMTGNALTAISYKLFKESKGLQIISIDGNLISDIERGTFEPLSQLETLTLARNNLAHICDFKLHQIKHLNLSRNSVEYFISREDHKWYRLEILDLSFNKLLYFPIIPKYNHLKYLYLQNNMIGALQSEATMVSEVNSLYDEIVHGKPARENHLHSNWRTMQLIHIDLSYNHFTSFPIETLFLLSSLESLNFSYNCLKNINWNIRRFSGTARQLFFVSLKDLNLQSNGLQYISPRFLEALWQIERLNLQDNLVQPCAFNDHRKNPQSPQQVKPNSSCVSFGQLRTLKHLNLRANYIKVLQEKAFLGTSLVSLDLAQNVHMVMHEEALESLQATLESLIISEINMSSSHLSLPCMVALNQLNISNNRLHELPNSLSCSSVRNIDLRNNTFVTFNYSQIHNLSTHLKTMYISGNSFNCCDNQWLTILNDTKIDVPDISETECVTDVTRLRLMEYLKTPFSYCSARTKTQEVIVGETIVILIFIGAVLTMLIVFSKKCCTQRSLLV
ncbi:transforming growth factor beta activator LRRC32-like isoform X1 [Gouania willdenowi]|uniref:transforming growth factor beta activator LRRC32-like isoform X1 n=1 Tax=Gouania willdenowi TaxID=441366 RepID=UPI001055A2A5|nr:transforming growth factor beta activator LRRC32-like isoform X1 [Gouania willdenowi]